MKNIKRIITIALIIIAIILLIFFIIHFHNNSSNIKLNGYYYENVEKNSFGQSIYYFESDGTCSIKKKSLSTTLTLLIVNEKYSSCKYEIKKNNLIINIYDDNYDKLIDTKTYTIESIDNGIKLNNIEFLTNNENISNYEDHFFENYSLLCASKVAKQYGVSNNCTTWKKVSDGFYNYSCGIDIRVFVEENIISYDTYNSKTGQFSEKGSCYKIIRKIEKDIIDSDEIVQKGEKDITNSGEIVTKEVILSGDDIHNISVNNLYKGLNASLYEPLEQIKIKINGTQNNLNKLDDLKVYIDLNNYYDGVYEVDLKLDIDESIYSYTIEPSKVKIKIS